MAQVRHTRSLVWALAATLSPCAAIAAEPQPVEASPESASTASLIQRLGSSVAGEREQSEARLVGAPGATLDVLIRAAIDTHLSPEQRLRLTRVAYQRFASTPRAALGISFQPAFVGGAESGAVIAGTIQGFDSQRALKPGDTIYALDDVRIHSMEDGKRVIQARDPGDRVALRVFRDGQPIIVHLTLGSMTDLERTSPAGVQRGPEPVVIRDAFKLRLQQASNESKDEAAQPLDLSGFWKDAAVPPTDAPKPVIAPKPATSGPTTIEVDDTPTSLTAGGRQSVILESQFDQFIENPQALQARISGIMRTMNMVDTQILNTTLQIKDPNLGAERRARAERDLRILQEKRAKLKLELESFQPNRQPLRP